MPDFTFNGNDLARLSHLVYSPGIPTLAGSTGTHRMRRAGQGSDFLDYRAYVPGDDIRRIDWIVFARLRQRVVRVLEHDETLYLSLLIDLSCSMAMGSPRTKAELACQLACGLAYIALSAGDRVTLSTFSAKLSTLLPNFHGRSAITPILRFLKQEPTGGKTDLVAAANDFCRRAKHRGLVIILSDFLSAGDTEEAIRVLLTHRFRILLIQILDPRDWAEGLTGPLRLVDSETEKTINVVASPERVADYRRHLREYVDRLESYCLRRGQFYLYARTSDDPLEIVTRGLRQRGVLR